MMDVTVVAPHPDDEVFGVGGIMRRLVTRGHRLCIVAVTDGELAFGEQPPGPKTQLVARRHEVRADALDRLGIANRVELVRLGLPDGSVADHESTLTDRLIELCGGLVFGTFRHDGHPDHEAVGRAVARAAAARRFRLVEYVVWGSIRERTGIACGRTVRCVRLDGSTHEAKRLAVQAFRSQIDPSPDGRPVVSDELVRQASSNVELLIL